MKILSSIPVDAVVTDVEMPKGNGLELMNWIRRELPALPVILMSGSLLDDTAKGTAAAIFTKPFNNRTLVEAVRKLVG